MIAFEGVSVDFGETTALNGVDLRVEAGDLCVLVGPSGSGKSTLLRLVNRLIRPSAGRVLVRGQDVAGLDPAPLRRSIGYVIQSIGLFPHRTVARNIATVPRLLGWPKTRIAERIGAMLALVHLDEPGIAARYPSELSGGQAQRVGLARALAGDPDLLLMDEPFGAVDPITRRSLRAELRRIHAATGKTVFLVTHDPGEALELATHLVVMREGRVAAAGRPEDLLRAGIDPFVRELLGGELVLRRLDLLRVEALARSGPPPNRAPLAEAIPADRTLREALTRMLERRSSVLAVTDAAGAPVGSISLADLAERSP